MLFPNKKTIKYNFLIDPNVFSLIKALNTSEWGELRGYYHRSFYFWDSYYKDHFNMVNFLKVEYFDGYCFSFFETNKKYIIKFRKTIPTCIFQEPFIKYNFILDNNMLTLKKI